MTLLPSRRRFRKSCDGRGEEEEDCSEDISKEEHPGQRADVTG